MKTYLLARLSEASTWRGLCWIIVGLGATLTSDDVLNISTLGPIFVGALGVAFPDKVKT